MTPEVFDAETAALDLGTYHAIATAHDEDIRCIHAFSDNQAVVKTDLAAPAGTIQSTFHCLRHRVGVDLESQYENRFFRGCTVTLASRAASTQTSRRTQVLYVV